MKFRRERKPTRADHGRLPAPARLEHYGRIVGCNFAGFTLVEVVVSVGLSVMVFAAILTGYIHATKRAEWSGYNLAAGATSVQQIEQARAAVWDTDTGNKVVGIPLLGRTTNGSLSGYFTLKGYSTNVLDIPYSGGVSNYLWVTNYVTLVKTNVVGNTNVPLQFLKVDAVWRFRAWGGTRYYTNSMATILAPDDRMLGN